jgi:hypothetical protein
MESASSTCGFLALPFLTGKSKTSAANFANLRGFINQIRGKKKSFGSSIPPEAGEPFF